MNGGKVTNDLVVRQKYCIFTPCMNEGQKEIFKVRVISAAFTTLALAVFKPFGLDAWQWQAYVHLIIIFILGVAVCMLTDTVMKYMVKIPCNMYDLHKHPATPEMTGKRTAVGAQTYGDDINYFIRRNLYFQIINTLLVTLMICLYRHLLLSSRVAENRLSWGNFFETLFIIAFCSFAIGLYWRFKFRGKYLAAELEDTRVLNEELKRLQKESEERANAAMTTITNGVVQALPQTEKQPTPIEKTSTSSVITLTGTTNETVTLIVSNLLYIEAVGNYMKVYHLRDGEVRFDMLRATSKQIEEKLHAYPMIVRCHRAFLVNLGQVEKIVSHSGTMQLVVKHCHDSIPVSRSNMSGIKEAIKGR